MNNIARAFSKISQIGINMVVTIGMCILFGKWLDKVFNTSFIFLAIFVFLGVASAFRNLYVLVIKDYKDIDKKQKSPICSDNEENKYEK